MTDQKCRICGSTKEEHKSRGHVFNPRPDDVKEVISRTPERLETISEQPIENNIIPHDEDLKKETKLDKKFETDYTKVKINIEKPKKERVYCKKCHSFVRAKTGKCGCPEGEQK